MEHVGVHDRTDLFRVPLATAAGHVTIVGSANADIRSWRLNFEVGAMVAEGRNYWSVSVWPSVVPGTAIALIVLGLNSLGDGLRDIFDPRLRRW